MKDDEQRRRIAEQLRHHYPGLVAAFTRRAGSRDLAGDLINDAITIMLQQINEARLFDVQNVAGYVFRVAVKLLRNHRAKIENQPSSRAPPEALNHLAQPDTIDPLELTEIAQDVRLALAALVPRDRAVLIAAYLEEQDRQTICLAQGLSDLQFNKVIERARKRMRKLIERMREMK